MFQAHHLVQNHFYQITLIPGVFPLPPRHHFGDHLRQRHERSGTQHGGALDETTVLLEKASS